VDECLDSLKATDPLNAWFDEVFPNSRHAVILGVGSRSARDAPPNDPQINQEENLGVTFQADPLPILDFKNK
jgi:hypothetical protein